MAFVYEKRSDRIFSINLNYELAGLNEIVTVLETKVLKYLEQQYFKEFPDNKKKLQEEHKEFTKSLITESQYSKYMLSYPKKSELEVFEMKNIDMNACRQYIYSNMTNVRLLSFRT